MLWWQPPALLWCWADPMSSAMLSLLGCKRRTLTIPLQSVRTSLVAQTVKCLHTTRETWVWSLGQEDPLEKEMAPHSSTFAWKIPWTEECGPWGHKESDRTEWLHFHFSEYYRADKGRQWWWSPQPCWEESVSQHVLAIRIIVNIQLPLLGHVSLFHALIRRIVAETKWVIVSAFKKFTWGQKGGVNSYKAMGFWWDHDWSPSGCGAGSD